LESLDAPESGAEVSAADYELIRRLCSALRRQMAEDLGTRQ
jgi:hypothetical protein